MYLEKTDRRITHPIVVDRDYYIARAGRCLEVRCRQTHAVLQVLEPPKDWGNNWLWSSCGFDGTICVPLDLIRFVRTDSPAAAQEPTGTFGNRATRQSPPPPTLQPRDLDRSDEELSLPNQAGVRMLWAPVVPARSDRHDRLDYRDDDARSSSRIHAGVSQM